MVDTHCHLDMDPFRYHEVEFLERARAAGVHTLISVGIDLASSEKAVALARRHPEVRAAVGLHPHEVGGVNISTVDAFRALAERGRGEVQGRVVAVGEVGLDYYRLDPTDDTTRREQQLVFDQFCTLAADLSLPLIIHARAAISNALAIARHYLREVAAVFHCFDGSLNEATAILDAGGYLGLANFLGYPKNDLLRQTVSRLPLNRIVLETDAPFLPPAARRGQPSEPADVASVADVLAEIKNLPVPVVERATDAAAKQLFAL